MVSVSHNPAWIAQQGPDICGLRSSFITPCRQFKGWTNNLTDLASRSYVIAMKGAWPDIAAIVAEGPRYYLKGLQVSTRVHDQAEKIRQANCFVAPGLQTDNSFVVLIEDLGAMQCGGLQYKWTCDT
jgi:hypothetical protein